MILAVGNVKGGVGKSTLAVNFTIGLAQRGQDVLLIDGDGKQHTSLDFTELRTSNHPDAPGYTAVALHGSAIRTQVRQLSSRYDHIIIDVGGRDDGSLRAALVVSQLIVIPAPPRSFDLWGADQTAELVREARELNENLRALAVLNRADVAGSDNTDALGTLEDLQGIEVSPHRLVARKAYSDAASQGLSVLEYVNPANREGSLKAREDFARLFDFLFPHTSKELKIA